MLAKFSGFNPKGLHMSFKKEKETFCVCVHLLRKAGTLNQEVSYCSCATTVKKCTKESVMHVQRCCFADLNLSIFFLLILLLSPSSLLNLGPAVVIQKFGYHGNFCWRHNTPLYFLCINDYSSTTTRLEY